MAGAGGEDIDDVVAELLALPPEQFTEARNAATKRLRADGRSEAADAIKGLPRPPVSLWALNRLAHSQPSLVAAFLRSADQLREAYRSGGDIRAAASPEREAEARVVAAAAEVARAEGRNVTEAVMERLRQTMHAAAADVEVATALRDGLLIREPAAPSIEALLGSLPRVSGATKAKAPRPRDHSDERTSERSRTNAPQQRDRAAERLALREQIAAARSGLTRARGEARAASDEARAARREWERSRKIAERAQQHSDAAEQHLQDLQRRLAEL
jgi:hypothetical protein